ncbi:hypothetical protein MCUN1_001637 [Malassezia cuniculi]|uniref:Large ribosomal subunit protein uL23m n=1 Tax=Malassezia cuniculi TaxID=948313 RepID=A0AAF0EY72_9BASI|nr:hypothetical protein MCUN1_001637 [Malassezia cuniculi]
MAARILPAVVRAGMRIVRMPTPVRTIATLPARRVAAATVAAPSAAAPAPAAAGHVASSQPKLAAEDKEMAVKARKMLRWQWLENDKRSELERFAAGAADVPAWFGDEYALARSFRTARARRWMPSAGDIQAATGERVSDVHAWLADEASRIDQGSATVSADAFAALDADAQVDLLLVRVWLAMSPEARENALVRAAYECVRRLGWRSGYSSGYPGTAIPAGLTGDNDARRAARAELREAEEERAWTAWQALSSEERQAEWDTAWQLRDRSLVYIDDSPASVLLGAPAPRWYETPQRAGVLQFLPNMLVRLVRNHTRVGEPYDPWKATFRVAHNVHKHALRSYLLAVYGLRTTWARSSVYRSPVVFSYSKKRRTVGRGRTFKKIEVGLLEPFVFPGLTKEFMRNTMFQQEMALEERRLVMRMTKGRRWRGRKPVAAHSRAVNRNYAYRNAGAPDADSEEPVKLLVRSGAIPTARHNNILAALAERRAAREARIKEYIAKNSEEQK